MEKTINSSDNLCGGTEVDSVDEFIKEIKKLPIRI